MHLMAEEVSGQIWNHSDWTNRHKSIKRPSSFPTKSGGNPEMDIHIEEQGDRSKKTVVMVHGAGGSSMTWFMQFRGLSRDLHLVALDLNGHGQSPDRQEDPRQSYLADIDFVVSQYDQPYLMGHSMGGALTQLYALQYPDKIDGIILVGTGAKLRVANIIFDLLDNDFEGYLKAMVEFGFHKETPKELIEASLDEIRKCPIHVIRRDFEFANSFDIMDKVDQISHRTLLIAGEADQLTPPKYLQYLHNKIKDSHLVIIPNAGHIMMLEQATQFNRMVANWVTSNE